MKIVIPVVHMGVVNTHQDGHGYAQLIAGQQHFYSGVRYAICGKREGIVDAGNGLDRRDDTTAYTTPPNSLKLDLIAGKKLIGCWCSLASTITEEVLGLAGFDWTLLDAEHSPNDVTKLIPQSMALRNSVSAPVVRPPLNEPIIIKRLLDAGFHNLLIPFVESAEQAQAAVAATSYPPEGIRGISVAQRNNRYGTLPDYFATINQHIAVMVQIESRADVDAVDAIAQVDGVDGIFVGPGDLSGALGYIGQPNHPEVQKVIKHLLDRAKTNGKPSGILAPAEADARRYMDWGCTFVAVGSDLGLFRAATQALHDKFLDKC